MTREEFLKGMAILEASYEGFTITSEKETVAIWYELLKEFEYEAFGLAIKRYISTSVYKPTVAGLKQMMVDVSSTKLIDADEAWGEVRHAISKHGYMATKDELQKDLSPITYSVAIRMGWQDICFSDRPDVIRGQFIKLYAAHKEARQLEQLAGPQLTAQTESYRDRLHGSGLKKLGEWNE